MIGTLRVAFIISLFSLFGLSISAQTLWLDSLFAVKNLHDTTIIMGINDRGRMFMRTSPDSAIYYFQEAVSFANKSKSRERELINQKASALRFIGIAHRQLGNNEAALEYYMKALEHFLEIDATAGIAVSHRNIGNLYFFQSDYPKAIEHYEKAISFFKHIDDMNGLASIYNNLGNIYENQGNYKSALENYYEALRIFETLNNKQYISVCLTNIGVIHYRQRNFQLALENLERSLSIKKEIDDKKGSSTILMNISSVYMGLWEQEALQEQKQTLTNKAIASLEGSIVIKKEINDVHGLTLCYNSMGEIYSKIGMLQKAMEYFDMSLSLSKSINNKRGLVFVYRNLAELLLKQGKYSESIENALKGLALAQEIESLSDQKSILFHLVKAYTATGECQKLTQYFNAYEAISDSLFSQTRAKALIEIETRYQTEKKEHEIELLSQENRLKEITISSARRQRNLYILIAFSLLALSSTLYLMFVNRKRMGKLLEEKNKELLELNITKDKFISILAHDLKNPFSSFTNIASALHDDFDQIDTNDQKHLVEQLHKSAIQVNTLLKNMLEWASIKNKSSTVELSRLNLKEIADEVAGSLTSFAHNLGLEIIVKVPDDIHVSANRTFTSSLLNNLLTNALKFSPEETKVTLSARIEDGNAIVVVEDKGIGIAEDDIEKLFRLEVDTRTIGKSEGKGTGLGLILCKELIERMNGRIWVESELGNGSKFFFSLPLYSER